MAHSTFSDSSDRTGLPRNSTSFPAKSSALLRALHRRYLTLLERQGPGEERVWAEALKYYQYLVRAVMTNPEFGIGASGNGRGLLIYHGMGMGKTILAIGVAMAMWDDRQPVVLAAKSLQRNFSDSVRRVVAMINPKTRGRPLEDLQAAALKRFRFATLDAHNMAEQVARAAAGVTPREAKRQAKRTGGITVPGSLDGKLLIVDEAHNLFRGIINSASETTNARQLYEMVMASKNLRILFLTGTPSSKHPFEMVPCFNMLTGTNLLPTQYDIFLRYYVDVKASTLKNREKLANRLLGLVSHALPTLPSEPGAAQAAGTREQGGFPEDLGTKVLDIEMGEDQYRQYLLARDREEAEGGGAGLFSAPREALYEAKSSLALPGAEREGGSTYYVRSRQLGNFAAPREFIDTTAPDRMPDLESLPAEAFSPDAGPKMAKAMELVEGSPGPVLVYSEFVGIGGLGVLQRYLEGAGFAEYAGSGEGPSTPASRYAVYHGGILPAERTARKDAFNRPANQHGALIKALLISKTGAEGLDLKNVRTVVELEPYWDKSREDQVKFRAIRLGSHDELPREEREVQTYLLLAVPNARVYAGIPEGKGKEEQTTDMRFHGRALKRHHLNLDARDLHRYVSLECSANGYGDCRLCVPTDALLFHADPGKDLRLPDPCEPVTESETVPDGSVEVDGVTYYYDRDEASPLGWQFYEYRKDLEGWAVVDPSNPLVIKLLRALKEAQKQEPESG